MDAFVEQIVKKKKGGKEIGIIVGSLILLAVLLFLVYFFLIPYIRQFFIILAAAAIYGEWWLITEQNVEYEYSVTNGDIDVDQITARRKRKRIVSVPGAKIESLEPYRAEAYAGRQFDRRSWPPPRRRRRACGASPTAARKTGTPWYCSSRSRGCWKPCAPV